MRLKNNPFLCTAIAIKNVFSPKSMVSRKNFNRLSWMGLVFNVGSTLHQHDRWLRITLIDKTALINAKECRYYKVGQEPQPANPSKFEKVVETLTESWLECVCRR